jgi:hypothetical protein
LLILLQAGRAERGLSPRISRYVTPPGAVHFALVDFP